jgi:hypothetical protein
MYNNGAREICKGNLSFFKILIASLLAIIFNDLSVINETVST